MRYRVGSLVRVNGKRWVATVMETAAVGGRHHYRIFPVEPQPLESSYWWEEWDLQPASILEAIAEAANGDDLPTGGASDIL